jgi:hypothetical protein
LARDQRDRGWARRSWCVAERVEGIDTLVLNLDNGPENNIRRTQFIQRVVDFVDEQQITERLTYYR